MALDNTRYDLTLDSNGDLYISPNGDFTLTPSDFTHQEDCIIAGPGWWKENPTRGVNIQYYQGATTNVQQLSKKIQVEEAADGYDSSPIISLVNSQLTVNPNCTPPNG